MIVNQIDNKILHHINDSSVHVTAEEKSALSGIGDLANQYVWEKQELIIEKTSLSSGIHIVYGLSDPYQSKRTLSYSSEIKYNNGSIELVNPLSVTLIAAASYDECTEASVLKGKYVKNAYGHESDIIFIPVNATIKYDYYSKQYRILASPCSTVSAMTQTVGYILTPTNTEPVEEGYTFISKGKFGGIGGDGIKIATGSYTGAGTYGSSNPNSLTFDFEPKFVSVYMYKNSNGQGQYIIAQFSPIINVLSNAIYQININGGTQSIYVTWSSDKKTVSWYGTSSSNGALYQLNGSGCEYYYIAIG